MISIYESKPTHFTQAYWETAKIAREKEKEKQRQRVYGHWIKLVQGLRIRQRLEEQYGTGTAASSKVEVTIENPVSMVFSLLPVQSDM